MSTRIATFCALGLLCAVALWACQSVKKTNDPVVSAEFGVYFGGHIQQRKEIPFELDATKQTHGFRITFADPPAESHRVQWQLSLPRFAKPRPNTAKGSALAQIDEVRTEVTGDALIGVGQRELSQVWTFQPGDPLGVWNIRITLDQRVLMDRPFLVYDQSARKQLNRNVDAGAAAR